MPRKARIEYPGAVYHVLNRGNYRTELFSVEKAGESFEETLFQACSRFGYSVVQWSDFVLATGRNVISWLFEALWAGLKLLKIDLVHGSRTAL